MVVSPIWPLLTGKKILSSALESGVVSKWWTKPKSKNICPALP